MNQEPPSIVADALWAVLDGVDVSADLARATSRMR
jgi:hypothetical protein